MTSTLATALTFDDGPSAVTTLDLLDILDSHKVPATFFCVGSRAAQNRSIVSEIAKRGHEIGNHSWSHQSFAGLPDEVLHYELNEAHNCLGDILGTPPKLLRPPFGVMNPHQKQMAHEWFGYSTVMWNIDTYDWKRPGVKAVSSVILGSLSRGSVVLLHDTLLESVAAVESALSSIPSPELQFVTVSNLRSLMAQKNRMKVIPV